MRAKLLLLLVAALCAEDWQEVRLASPLCTVLLAPQTLASSSTIGVEIEVPEQSAVDLGCGFWVGERSGSWFQLPQGRLESGRQRMLQADLGPGQPWTAEPGGPRWSAWRRTASTRWGIFLWSAGNGGQIRVRWTAGSGQPTAPTPVRICDVQIPPTARTGERWQMTLRPEPYPRDPFDPRIFAADLIVTRPDGAVERRPAFHDQPMRLDDRGDREAGRMAAAERFCVRYRPRIPGVHRLALGWRIRDGGERRVELPDLAVSGEPWDDIVRVDRSDPRFLCRQGGVFTWPVGLNLQSVTDPRTRDTYDMRPTVDRGTASYAAYLARLAGAGGDAAEIWLCSWNLGLEWNRDWYGYFGLGRYSEFNAARLDRVLDLAWDHGIRLVLNLNNHGQFLPRAVESEWNANPYNRSQGGPLTDSDAVFTDREARRLMEQSRRYLAGRVADHPAVLTWKLWSEVDLTSRGIKTIRAGQPGIDELRTWHAEAAASWKRLDAYQHPVSTHFATTWQNAHPRIVDLPGIDLILLDAYFKAGVYTRAENLAGLMVETADAMQRFGKPYFATEYGGGHEDRLLKKLEVEHATGAWLALVCGHAAAPMLWWREWVDQQDRWAPYQAIRAFLAGEDLRGAAARSLAVQAVSPAGALWCRAWNRPGRMLIYLQDRTWAVGYRTAPAHDQATVLIGEEVAAGQLRVAWWDADTGAITQSQEFDHPGGRLELAVPPFSRHCAAKLSRR